MPAEQVSCCSQATRRESGTEQQAHARTRVSDFPPEILTLLFSLVDTATLLGAVHQVCREWRAACAHDVYGPKVRLKLSPQQLGIRPECLGLWVAAAAARFTWASELDASECKITDGVLECADDLQRLTSLDLRGLKESMFDTPGSKITDCGQDHGHRVGARGPTHTAHLPKIETQWQDHGRGVGARCPALAAH